MPDRVRTFLIRAAALVLPVYALVEVNYPHLRPQSQLALFALLGLALCFLVPVSLFIAAVVVMIGGIEVFPHVLVGVGFTAAATLFTVEQVGPMIPFSEPFRPQVGMTNFGLLMLTSITLGGAVAVHLVAAMVPGAPYALFLFYALLFRYWLGRLRRRGTMRRTLRAPKTRTAT